MYFIPLIKNHSSTFISYIHGIFIIRQYFIWLEKWMATENGKKKQNNRDFSAEEK